MPRTAAPKLGVLLAEAVRAGNERRVRDLVVEATEKERRAAARTASKEYEEVRWLDYDTPRRRAGALAWLGTATARQVLTDAWDLEFAQEDQRDARLAYDVVAARDRTFVETLARGIVRQQPGLWLLLRRAVREGLVERPDDDAYTLGMVGRVGVVGLDAFHDVDATYKGLLADPELLQEEVWRIFEVDAGTELTNATVWTETEREHGLVGGFERGENRWLRALVRLAAERRLDRGRLLDASLDALMRDFRPSMVGWYAKLHEALEPTRAEREERVDRYLALLTSPVPTVVKAGLTGLRAVEDAVPVEGLARAALGPLTQKQKNLAVDTLDLLARAAEREPEARPALLEATAQALGHERSDVQERAVALLERFDEAPRARLLDLVDAVAASLRPRVQALTGLVQEEEPPELPRAEEVESMLVALTPFARAAEPAEAAVAAALAGRWPEPVRPSMTVDLLRRVGISLRPVESVDELIELAASLLEGQGTGEDVERFLDGVSRLCGRRPRGFERRTSGLLERADFREDSWEFAADGVSLVAVVVRAWAAKRRPRAFPAPPTILGFLSRRALEVATRAVHGAERPLLALPSHAGGWLDPEVLAGRRRGTGRVLNRPGSADRTQARLRAFPDAEPIAFGTAVVERRWPWGRTDRRLALRARRPPAALGDLFEAVSSLGGGSQNDLAAEWWVPVSGWGSLDALGVRWSLLVLPSFPEVAFAGAAMAAAEGGEGADYDSAVVLEHALGADVPIGEAGWLAVAAGLLGRTADVRRVATDLLVAAISDGRFDPEGLGRALGWLSDNGLGKPGRLEGAVRDAGRISPLHAAQSVRAVVAFLAACETTPQRVHGLLDAALEHAVRVRYGVEGERERSALERIAGEVSRSSKLGRLARGLLEVETDGGVAAGLFMSAAAAIVSRGQRIPAAP